MKHHHILCRKLNYSKRLSIFNDSVSFGQHSKGNIKWLRRIGKSGIFRMHVHAARQCDSYYMSGKLSMDECPVMYVCAMFVEIALNELVEAGMQKMHQTSHRCSADKPTFVIVCAENCTNDSSLILKYSVLLCCIYHQCNSFTINYGVNSCLRIESFWMI